MLALEKLLRELLVHLAHLPIRQAQTRPISQDTGNSGLKCTGLCILPRFQGDDDPTGHL